MHYPIFLILIGGLIRWIIGGCKKDIDDLLDDSQRIENFIVSLLFLLSSFIIAYVVMNI